MKSRRFNRAVIIAVLCFHGICAQQQGAAPSHTLQLDAKSNPPSASVADLAWLTGHWTGTGLGGLCDEVWSRPNDNSIMGMFRLSREGKAVFYEFVTIVQERGTLVMKIKHFNFDMVGWEEKNTTVNFPLVKIFPGEVYFDSLTYRRADGDTLDIFLLIKEKSGSVSEETFHLRRVRE